MNINQLMGKFLTPEESQAWGQVNPLIEMFAKGGLGLDSAQHMVSPAGETGRTGTAREVARAQGSRKRGGSTWDNGKPNIEPQQVRGGGSGQAKHDPFDMAAIFAQMGDPRAIKALGMNLTDWSRTPTPGVNNIASAFSQSGNASGALGGRAASRNIQTQPGARAGLGEGIGRPTGKGWDTSGNDEYTRRQRELKYRDQDADFEDRRTRELLQMIMGAGDMNEREVTEGDQYVNSAGAWKRMPTREVRTKSISPLDILRMLGR